MWARAKIGPAWRVETVGEGEGELTGRLELTYLHYRV